MLRAVEVRPSSDGLQTPSKATRSSEQTALRVVALAQGMRMKLAQRSEPENICSEAPLFLRKDGIEFEIKALVR